MKLNYISLITLTISISTLQAAAQVNTARDNNISVIGIGRLGLCTALCFERAGYNVLGVDIFPSYVEQVNNKTLKSPEPFLEKYLQASHNLRATTSLDEALTFADVYFIIVATPSTPAKEAYDHSTLSRLLSEINKRRVKNKHMVICCTVFPGYIRNVARTLLSDCENISISYNPEFIAQGNIISWFESPDMVLIGEGSKQAGDFLEKLYRSMCTNSPRICRMSPESAEVTKLSINCFITTKIAYANMVGDIADATPGANKYDILQAVGGDKRIGDRCLKPGYGFGGPCFPRDNRALGSYAKTIGIQPIIPEATDQSNALHAQIMAQALLAQKQDEYVFEDVNYKDNCPVVILEESQKLAVAEMLAKHGKKVTILDRACVIDEVKQKYGSLFNYT
jgi:nucleotide sugar dehydrogenase